jgi:tripartite-type tricarboxylate transporter receptor subunit TctC
MSIVKRSVLTGLAGALVLGVGSVAGPQDAFGWEPKKPVDFVIMAGKGGGADKMARLMQSVIEKHSLASKPFVPINKPGGSGAEALIHLKQKTGDDHTIMVTLNSFYTTPLRQPNLQVDISTFAPIGRMAEDTFLLWVHKDSGINDVNSFVSAAKAKGNDWIMAGTGKGQEDQLLTTFLNNAYGLNMKYVPYKGGGRVAKELAGKHADSTVNNPSEQLGFYEAGTTRPLAAFTPTRLPLFKDAPTFKELGKDFVYFMQRSVVGAPGMSKEAEAYYRDVFQKVYSTDEWQGYMKKKSLQGDFLTGQALKDYWMRERTIHEGRGALRGELSDPSRFIEPRSRRHASCRADYGRHHGTVLRGLDVEERGTPHRLDPRGGSRRWGVLFLARRRDARVLRLDYREMGAANESRSPVRRALHGQADRGPVPARGRIADGDDRTPAFRRRVFRDAAVPDLLHALHGPPSVAADREHRRGHSGGHVLFLRGGTENHAPQG